MICRTSTRRSGNASGRLLTTFGLGTLSDREKRGEQSPLMQPLLLGNRHQLQGACPKFATLAVEMARKSQAAFTCSVRAGYNAIDSRSPRRLDPAATDRETKHMAVRLNEHTH
jgi:hypothetical protein